MKISVLPEPVGLLKLMLNSFLTSIIQGRELCWRDFIKCTLDIVMVMVRTLVNRFASNLV